MTDSAENKEQLSFEQALQKLEGIVSELEDGSLGLDDSLKQFEEGMQLLRKCHGLLEQAEQKIEVLTSVSRDGQERTRPLADTRQSQPTTEDAVDEDGTLF